MAAASCSGIQRATMASTSPITLRNPSTSRPGTPGAPGSTRHPSSVWYGACALPLTASNAPAG